MLTDKLRQTVLVFHKCQQLQQVFVLPELLKKILQAIHNISLGKIMVVSEGIVNLGGLDLLPGIFA